MNRYAFIALIIFWPLAIHLDSIVDEFRSVGVDDGLPLILLGSAPSFICCLLVPVPGKFIYDNFNNTILTYLASQILYELGQIWWQGVFDYKDIVAAIFGALVCRLVFNNVYINKLLKGVTPNSQASHA
ncbi:hypothetical protein OE749_15705 [Aestuariibacter sp. AA17]|uniref:VanZ-like domain-containing protein n=1 Tax=Fluctibacter corallii TaxID=2984329 RepID=A0ABT3ABY1_9ALTE|nr:hypothetical protein [Aestuariibacter sp. AA17]MCV2886138.1 hypothetical protein [Aestuariibacter sp. AA17]